jgi:hypothetical protein
VTLAEIGSNCAQNPIERKTLGRKSPRQGSLAHAQPPRDFAHLCLAMRQEHGDGIFNARRK